MSTMSRSILRIIWPSGHQAPSAICHSGAFRVHSAFRAQLPPIATAPGLSTIPPSSTHPRPNAPSSTAKRARSVQGLPSAPGRTFATAPYRTCRTSRHPPTAHTLDARIVRRRASGRQRPMQVQYRASPQRPRRSARGKSIPGTVTALLRPRTAGPRRSLSTGHTSAASAGLA